MPQVQLDAIPYMSPLFERCAHARKMSIASMVVFPGDKNHLAIADATMSNELLSVAESGLLSPEAYERIFFSGRANGKIAETVAEKFPPKSKSSVVEVTDFAAIPSLALAHPELPANTFASLLADLAKFSSVFRHAILANPQARHLRSKTEPLISGKSPHISCLFPRCAYADLGDKDEIKLVSSAFAKLTARHRRAALELIMVNPTFATPMARQIHDIVLFDEKFHLPPRVTRRFLETSADREVVRAGARPMSLIEAYDEIVISPQMHPDEILETFRKMHFTRMNRSHELQGASFTMSSACPDEILESLVKLRNPLLGADRFAGGKFDAKIIKHIVAGDIPSKQLEPLFASLCPETTDALLFAVKENAEGRDRDKQFRASMLTCSHKNFDWNGHPLKEYPNVCKLVAAATQRDFAENYSKNPQHIVDGNAAIFSERTSALRLDKIAAMFPELRELAACHPNGGEIISGDNPKKFRSAVFPVASLAGAGKLPCDKAQSRSIAI